MVCVYVEFCFEEGKGMKIGATYTCVMVMISFGVTSILVHIHLAVG